MLPSRAKTYRAALGSVRKIEVDDAERYLVKCYRGRNVACERTRRFDTCCNDALERERGEPRQHHPRGIVRMLRFCFASNKIAWRLGSRGATCCLFSATTLPLANPSSVISSYHSHKGHIQSEHGCAERGRMAADDKV